MFYFLAIIEDEKARHKLEEIYIQYHREMYYLAMSILKDSHDAQDVVQISILKLANYADKLEGIHCNKTKSLIVTIVRNASIDIYRYRQRHQHVQLDDVQEHLVDDSEALDNLVIRLGNATYLAQKLAKLKQEYADVLALKYYYDFQDKEIAEIMSISHENVRVRLKRAKAALYKLLEKDSDPDINKRTCVYES